MHDYLDDFPYHKDNNTISVFTRLSVPRFLDLIFLDEEIVRMRQIGEAMRAKAKVYSSMYKRNFEEDNMMLFFSNILAMYYPNLPSSEEIKPLIIHVPFSLLQEKEIQDLAYFVSL